MGVGEIEKRPPVADASGDRAASTTPQQKPVTAGLAAGTDTTWSKASGAGTKAKAWPTANPPVRTEHFQLGRINAAVPRLVATWSDLTVAGCTYHDRHTEASAKAYDDARLEAERADLALREAIKTEAAGHSRPSVFDSAARNPADMRRGEEEISRAYSGGTDFIICAAIRENQEERVLFALSNLSDALKKSHNQLTLVQQWEMIACLDDASDYLIGVRPDEVGLSPERQKAKWFDRLQEFLHRLNQLDAKLDSSLLATVIIRFANDAQISGNDDLDTLQHIVRVYRNPDVDQWFTGKRKP